jgi:tubulin polyglutamylase TTLL4
MESTHVYNSVVNAMKEAGFKMISTAGWNVLWSGVHRPEFLSHLSMYQKINHFPGAYSLGRKDNLWRNISRMKRHYGMDYNIAPPSYIFPEDFKKFQLDREAD